MSECVIEDCVVVSTFSVDELEPVACIDDYYYWRLAVLTDDNDDFAMLDRVSDQLRINIMTIFKELSDRCDWAEALDYIGYSCVDTIPCKTIARVGIRRPEGFHQPYGKIEIDRTTPVYLNSRELQLFARRLYKYRKQIRGNFFVRLFEGE